MIGRSNSGRIDENRKTESKGHCVARSLRVSALRNDASLTCQSGRPGMAQICVTLVPSSCFLSQIPRRVARRAQLFTDSSSSTKSALYGGRAAYICVTGARTCWWMWGRFYIWITYSPLTPVLNTIHRMSMRERGAAHRAIGCEREAERASDVIDDWSHDNATFHPRIRNESRTDVVILTGFTFRLRELRSLWIVTATLALSRFPKYVTASVWKKIYI